MTKEILQEVIWDLVKPIEPYGDSNIDAKRSENLDKVIYIFDWLKDELLEVVDYVDRPEASMNEMGQDAHMCLYNIMKELEDYFDDRYIRNKEE